MNRVDVHHHYFPPDLIAAQQEADPKSVRPEFLKWNVSRAVEELDRGGIATAIVSTSSRPSIRGKRLRSIARSSNVFAAEMARSYPKRFGFFAFLPMPDVEGSLLESAYALDELGADGIGLMTSYGNCWLGDSSFVPLLEELDRRGCIAYVHPLLPDCCRDILPYVPAGMLEYPYDTGRTIVSLLLSGALARFPRIRWIFSHGGGPLPMLAGRIEAVAQRYPNAAQIAPNGVAAEFRRLYCETTNAAYRGSMAALREMLPIEHILFGTDYPYYETQQNVMALQTCGLSNADLRAIEHDNAVALFARLSA